MSLRSLRYYLWPQTEVGAGAKTTTTMKTTSTKTNRQQRRQKLKEKTNKQHREYYLHGMEKLMKAVLLPILNKLSIKMMMVRMMMMMMVMIIITFHANILATSLNSSGTILLLNHSEHNTPLDRE